MGCWSKKIASRKISNIVNIIGNHNLQNASSAVSAAKTIGINESNSISALEKFSGVRIWNLGSGSGYSVLEIVTAFEKISLIKIPYKLCPRRDGDVSTCWANIDKAKAELDWFPAKTLDDMLLDSWRWQKNNPDGYE